MKIFFATCTEKSEGTADDQILRDTLIDLGHQVKFQVWSDNKVLWSEADFVLIRSTWDYHRHLPAFLNWAEQVSTESCLLNSTELLKWNSSKHYLLELESKGLPVVASFFASEESQASSILKEKINKYGKVVIKPAVSATADLTFVVTEDDQTEELIASILQRGDLLLQPYITSITEIGELSLVYFNVEGEFCFSHAVHKKPLKGDFRVQSDFGGTVASIRPSPSIIDLGKQTLQALPEKPLYARVDLVDWTTHPLIGEVELIEPELFFRCHPKSANLLINAMGTFK